MGKYFQSRILDSETIGLYYLVQLKYKGITFLFFLPNSALPFLREISLFSHDKNLLMKVKEETENVSLKPNTQKTKIMASSAISSQQIDGTQ